MGRWVWVVLALAWAARGAAEPNMTQAPGPGTASPSSGNCGFPTSMPASEILAQLRMIYDEVFGLTGVASKPELTFDPVRNTNPAFTRRKPAKAPAGPVAPPAPLEIVYNRGICDQTHSMDEVAFIFAHELAHVKNSDIPDLEAAEPGFATACSNQPPCISARRDGFIMPRERAADAQATGWLKGSRYKPESGAAWMDHLRDLVWAVGKDGAIDPNHEPAAQRAAQIRDWAKINKGISSVSGDLK